MMPDSLESLSSWINETRKKVSLFNSYVDYLVISLDHLEKTVAENKRLRGALLALREGLDRGPGQISYDRDQLAAWLDEELR